MPQRIISPLLACAARQEAETASAALTSQSTSIGSEATLSASTNQPKIAPTTAPPTISAQPRGVGEDHRQEAADRGRRRPAEKQRVEHAGGDQPADENQQQQPRHDPHIVEGRALADVEEVEPVDLRASSRGAARARRSRRRRRSEQRDAGDNRKEEGHQRHGWWSSPPRQVRSRCRSARRRRGRRGRSRKSSHPCLSEKRRSSSPIVRTGIGLVTRGRAAGMVWVAMTPPSTVPSGAKAPGA